MIEGLLTLARFGGGEEWVAECDCNALVQEALKSLAARIDESEAQLPALHSFILPGGHRQAAVLHLARTVARRAERLVWSLSQQESVPRALGIYLNRLSDLFFSWARLQNQAYNVDDVPWQWRGEK